MAWGDLDAKRIRVVEKALTALPQTTTSDLFTVVGTIEIVQLYGVVTTAIQNQANNTKFIFNHATLTDVDLCAVADIANDGVGTILSITGTFATALQEGAAVVGLSIPQLVGEGTIQLSCAASNTGAARFVLAYRALDPRGNVTPA